MYCNTTVALSQNITNVSIRAEIDVVKLFIIKALSMLFTLKNG
jgi:hypothetical protein